MFHTDPNQALAYAQQVQQRVAVINQTLTSALEKERRQYTRDIRQAKLTTYIIEKTEILTEFILMGHFTQKRINVIEQYLQELEVLLNLDQ